MFRLLSDGYPTRDVVMQWMNGTASVQTSDPKPALPEMKWVDTEVGECNEEYTTGRSDIETLLVTLCFWPTGTFSCLFAGFHLNRQLSFYMINAFIPSTLIVLLSWLALWIDIKSVPARISLGLLTGQSPCLHPVAMTTLILQCSH